VPLTRVLHVVGARPNFMKIAPIMRALAAFPDRFQQFLVHTGQHYDGNMSKVFFDELDLPRPDVNLEVGSGSHAQQTALIMQRFEPLLLQYRPDWILVPGDVNSTMACALVAGKLGVRTAHVEAGLRSFDRTMPEEINRVVTDHVADLLFTPSRDGDRNLEREGIAPDKIRFVGNVMIDTLVRLLPRAEARWPGLRARFGLERFVLVTLHRPSNVDDLRTLGEVMAALAEIGRRLPVLFPVHPRTRKNIDQLGLKAPASGLLLVEPLGYLDFLALESHAALVLSDSGGIQEETTYLGVPCLTARPNTERPVTIRDGTNSLVASRKADLLRGAEAALARRAGTEKTAPPERWDGRAAERIAAELAAEAR